MKVNPKTKIVDFLAEIILKFPETKIIFDKHDEDMLTAKFEAFAELTTRKISEGKLACAKKYLDYVSAKLKQADAIEREYIDVYYTENLFWDASENTIKTGWKLVPQNLQKLYVDFHGKTPLEK